MRIKYCEMTPLQFSLVIKKEKAYIIKQKTRRLSRFFYKTRYRQVDVIVSSETMQWCAVTVFEREREKGKRKRRKKRKNKEANEKPRLLPLGSFPGSRLEIEVANHDASFLF